MIESFIPKKTMLSQSELKDYLQLAFTPHLGAISFLKLLKEFKHPNIILGTPYAKLQPFIEKPQAVSQNWNRTEITEQFVTPALKWLNTENNCYILTLLDSEYPIELTEVYPPPPVLFLRGNKNLLTLPKISIVGSRKATPQGLSTTQKIAQEIEPTKFFYSFWSSAWH